jgi:hypothetical protein
MIIIEHLNYSFMDGGDTERGGMFLLQGGVLLGRQIMLLSQIERRK